MKVMKSKEFIRRNGKVNGKVNKRSKSDKEKKRNTYESAYALYVGRELILDFFKSGMFPIKIPQGKGLKILTPK